MLLLTTISSAPGRGQRLDLGSVFLDAGDVFLEHRLCLLGVAVGPKEALPGDVSLLIIGHEDVGEKAIAEDILGDVLGVSLPVLGRQEGEVRCGRDLGRGCVGLLLPAGLRR